EILIEVENAAKLLDDMLMLARSDAGHVEVAFAPVELQDVLADVAARMRVLAEEKRQTLRMSLPLSSATVSGDAALLRRLAWILMDNAVKYTASGGSIHVKLAQSNGSILLQVSDSGKGMPASALPHIFERFYRVDAARSAEEGTGLGLAIAKW